MVLRRWSPTRIVDLGSGTGLSARWAAGWAEEVVGVEPSADMREAAEAAGGDGVRYVQGWAHATGLPDGCADVVLAVQAMHWMEPATTLAEVGRILRPGGVFAALDCDWPPTLGVPAVERAWAEAARTIRRLESDLDDIGVRRWPKERHLANLEASGSFDWCHEVCLHRTEDGDADRLIALLRSQGDYQTVHRAGYGDDELGLTAFAAACRDALRDSVRAVLFSFRVRLGVVAAGL